MAAMGAVQWLTLAATTYTTVQSGKIESANLKMQAKAEETNARTREIERKRNLIKSLAMQNVRGAASGVTAGTGSSAQAIQREDISRKELDTLTDVARTEQRASQLRENAAVTKRTSLLSAAGEGARSYGRAKQRGKL
ncbi:MAG: hypothetical protein KAR06_03795 [Deltaproteobacteria bacterium]|nr:hypothetical protein [Deltaproteobacteria bacterium]